MGRNEQKKEWIHMEGKKERKEHEYINRGRMFKKKKERRQVLKEDKKQWEMIN